MGDAPPPQTADRRRELLIYRPLSGVAIAALACATPYALVVVLGVVLLILKGEPLIPPVWLLLLPIVGAILGFVALRQIRDSEGTRAGAAIARWALGLSILSGTGALVYTLFTGLAVKQQANAFLMEKGPDAGFFPLLREGDVNEAFLLTRLPRERRGVNPKNLASMERFEQADAKNPRGALTLFRGSDLVRALRTTPAGKAEVEPLGVSWWGAEDKGYRVDRTYRLKTPEATYTLPLTTLRFDADSEGRRWMVLWGPTDRLPRPELTPFGAKMLNLRFAGHQFASDFLKKLERRAIPAAFLSTRPPGDRAAVAKLLAQGTDPATQRLFEDFKQGKNILQAEGIQGVDAGLLQRARTALPRQLFGPDPPEPASRMTQDAFKDAFRTAVWEKGDGQLRIAYDLDYPLKIPEPDGTTTLLALLGKVVVETDEDAAPATAQWRIVRLEFDRAASMRMPVAAGRKKG